MEYGFTTAAYVVAAVLFILSLGGLSGQESAKRAVWYGIVAMALAIVATLCNAVMAIFGIGLKVATLPVMALGVGVGVDYGIYLYERMQHELAMGKDVRTAFYEAMCQRGTAALFTAVTMSVGVGTWVFAPLKFQADMGVLLAFMFLVNVFGAIFLLPGLAAWFNRSKPLVKVQAASSAPHDLMPASSL